MFKLTCVFGVVASLCVVGIIAEPAALSRRFSKNGGRMIKGITSGRSQFPYMAYITSFNTTISWRAGMLISHSYVITCAHTMLKVERPRVLLGAWNRTDINELGQQARGVASDGVLIHPQYDRATNINDIALIKLYHPIQYNEFIQPIPIPKSSAKSLQLVGRKANAAGWGLTSNNSNSDVLQYIEIDIIDNSNCKAFDDDVNDSNICISTAEGSSTCYGDSGGPLVIKNGTQDVLVGILSKGTVISCKEGKPIIFTRVTSFLDWIKNNTDLHDFQDII